MQHHKNVNDILQNLLRIIKLDAPTSLKAREAEKGCKKAKNGNYIILIEQQVQHHKNVNDVL